LPPGSESSGDARSFCARRAEAPRPREAMAASSDATPEAERGTG
jgi:hypothetical protein